MDDLRTPKRKARDERDQMIYSDYNEMMAQKGAMSSVVTQKLMEKYNIKGQSTIWLIRKAIENNLKN